MVFINNTKQVILIALFFGPSENSHDHIYKPWILRMLLETEIHFLSLVTILHSDPSKIWVVPKNIALSITVRILKAFSSCKS